MSQTQSQQKSLAREALIRTPKDDTIGVAPNPILVIKAPILQYHVQESTHSFRQEPCFLDDGSQILNAGAKTPIKPSKAYYISQYKTRNRITPCRARRLEVIRGSTKQCTNRGLGGALLKRLL